MKRIRTEYRVPRIGFGRVVTGVTMTILGAALLTAHWTPVFAAETTRIVVEEPPALTTLKEKVSYGLGVDIARNFKRQRIEADLDLVVKGLKDGLSGVKLLIPDEELHTIMGAFQHEISKRQLLAMKIASEENTKKGETFLEENRKKDGVRTLPSGLQYKILKAGDGKKPTEADIVECHYRGTLVDGTALDSSQPDKPAIFKIAGVIPGWKEALQLMAAGSKWQLFIPPHLAYGEKGGGGRIGPNATLVFDLELLAVK